MSSRQSSRTPKPSLKAREVDEEELEELDDDEEVVEKRARSKSKKGKKKESSPSPKKAPKAKKTEKKVSAKKEEVESQPDASGSPQRPKRNAKKKETSPDDKKRTRSKKATKKKSGDESDGANGDDDGDYDDNQAPKKSAKSKGSKKKSTKNKVSHIAKELLEKIEIEIEKRNDYSQSQLKALLRQNAVKMTGDKNDLVRRVAECSVLGALPQCVKCGGGKLDFDIKSGSYFCKGFFDDDRFVPCPKRKFSFEEIVRIPWKE